MAWHGYMGACVWLASLGLSLAGVGWARLWFYQLAWWSYILLLDAWLMRRQGRSPLCDQPAGFLLLGWVSVAWWLVFELINLRLENWHYLDLPPLLWQRQLGAFIAYATVLPGVLLTAQALKELGLFRRLKVRPLTPSRGWYPYFLAVGAILLLASLLWPRIFFPAVWLGPLLLLEALNHRLGAPSLMADWQAGDLSRPCQLLAAGLFCGLLWESMNWLAGARWAYAIPYLNQPKLFAMPLAGYLGFPPFALECFCAQALLTRLSAFFAPPATPERPAAKLTRRFSAWGALALLGVFDFWVLDLMERHLYFTLAAE